MAEINFWGVTWAAAISAIISLFALAVSITSLVRQARNERKRRRAIIFVSSNELQWDLSEEELNPLEIWVTNFGEQPCYDVRLEFDYTPLLAAYKIYFADCIISESKTQAGADYFDLRCYYEGPRRLDAIDKSRMHIEDVQSNRVLDGIGPSETCHYELKYQVQDALAYFVTSYGICFGGEALLDHLQAIGPLFSFTIAYVDVNGNRWLESFDAGLGVRNLGMNTRTEPRQVTRFRLKLNISTKGKQKIH